MMRNRLTVASAATLTLLTAGVFGPARGGETMQPAPQMNGFEFCAMGSGSSGCLRFQGYIYAGRNATAPAAPPDGSAMPAADPPLGDERLYIHVGGAEAR